MAGDEGASSERAEVSDCVHGAKQVLAAKSPKQHTIKSVVILFIGSSFQLDIMKFRARLRGPTQNGVRLDTAVRGYRRGKLQTTHFISQLRAIYSVTGVTAGSDYRFSCFVNRGYDRKGRI